MKFVLILGLALSSTSFATVEEVVQGANGNQVRNTARIQKVINVAKLADQKSSLTVNFASYSLGGFTSKLENKSVLYLTTFGKEFGSDAQSLHLVMPINELISAKQVRNGIFEVVVNQSAYSLEHHASDERCENWNGTNGLKKVTIDGKNLIDAVKNLQKGTSQTLDTEITIKYECI